MFRDSTSAQLLCAQHFNLPRKNIEFAGSQTGSQALSARAVLLLCLSTSVAIAAEPADQPARTRLAGTLNAKHAGIEEVVVTAQKRSERLQKVPITVTVLSSQQLARSGITDTLQLSAVTPGLASAFVAGNFEPHLRGIGTSSDGPGVENPVALYVDGVYYASQAELPPSFFDVNQVSVLKGPQGTLFGRNASAGVIQINTKDPSQEFSAAVQTSLDNYLTTTNDAYINGALTDKLAANLFVHYAVQGNGWGENIDTGKDIHKDLGDEAARLKFLYQPSPDLRIKLGFDFENKIDNNGANFIPAPGTEPLLPGFKPSSNTYDIDSYLDSRDSLQDGGAYINVDKDFGFAHLVDIAAFRQFHSVGTFSPTVSPIPAEDLIVRTQGNQVTEELQLISATKSWLTWATGLYYFYSDEETSPGHGLSINLRGPLAPTPFSVHEIDVHTHIVDNSIAGYGQATAEILPDTHLTAGLRYTYENKTFQGSENAYLNNGISIGNLPLPPIAPSISYEKLTWRFALDHSFTPDVLGYVSYNRGFKSGGYNSLDPTNPPYGPEQLDAYEIGMKSQWFDHRLQVNLAGFYYDYSNIQVSRYTTTQVIYNGAGATLRGVDLDAQARLTDALRLSGSLEYLYSVFTKFPGGQQSRPLPNGGALLFAGDDTGNALPDAPTFTLTTAADYDIPLPTGSNIDLNVTNYYNAGYYTEADNFLRQPHYDYLNVSGTWTAPNGKLSLKLFANNLLNRAVLTQGATLNVAYIVAYSNPPRLFGATLAYKF